MKDVFKNDLLTRRLRISISFFLLIISYSLCAQAIPDTFNPKIVFLQPTGSEIEGMPEMVVLPDSSELYNKLKMDVDNSFIKDMLDIYYLAQVYLLNKSELDSIEPAYLALTDNQGGFAKFGFALKTNEQHILKPGAPYIDITKDYAGKPADQLMSVTQLFPHEMGHVLIHLLCREDSVNSNSRSVDMHFFSIITDYSTAFNEGFAEHLENVSRYFEQNEEIRRGIESDATSILKTSKSAIKGFDRDFHYPFRLGYYKASMINWYQKFEDYKRYAHAFNGEIQFKNKAFHKGKPEDRLSYTNAGVHIDTSTRRNYVQLLATEGAVSAFFTKLSISDLKDLYQGRQFYRDFVLDTMVLDDDPRNIFTPLQNQFLKYIKVLHSSVVFNYSEEAQLIDFIEGYCAAFPEETQKVHSVFKNSLGQDYISEVPPPLWILVKEYDHRLVVFDLFGAITVPIYTFDLNAAETADLITVPGIGFSSAQKIILHREQKGFFTDWIELEEVAGLSKEAAEKIRDSKFDLEYAESILNGFNAEMSIMSFVLKPIFYIYKRAGLYFLIFFSISYFLLIKGQRYDLKAVIWIIVKYLLLWLLLVFTGLMYVLMAEGKAGILFTGTLLLFGLIAAVLYRRNQVKRNRTIILLLEMYLVILLSII